MTHVATLFDQWAEAGRAEGMETGHLRTAEPLLRNMPWGHGRRVLDLGCGNAWAARFAQARGAHSVAIDVSPQMVRKAADNGITAVRADMTHLPFDDHCFDHVWSMEALYYAPDPDAALHETARVTKPGGMVTILIDFYRENSASHSWPDDVGVPMALRSEGAWVQALTRAGFENAGSDRLKAVAAEDEEWKRSHGTLHLHGVRARNG